MAHEHERDEWRSALRADPPKPGDCYRHDYRPNRNGGATCTGCGDTIDRSEL